jgi:hypothetical protein
MFVGQFSRRSGLVVEVVHAVDVVVVIAMIPSLV